MQAFEAIEVLVAWRCCAAAKAAEDCRTPGRFAHMKAFKIPTGFGMRQSSAAFRIDYTADPVVGSRGLRLYPAVTQVPTFIP